MIGCGVRSLCLVLLVAACHPAARTAAPAPAPVIENVAPPAPPQRLDLDSADVLGRADVSASVLVKHVLLAWADLAGNYHGRLDPRAAKRTHEEAAKLAEELAAKLRANPDSIDALAKKYSEDPGSIGQPPYKVETDTPFVPQFKALALRLRVGEVGIVTTVFGYHVMVRVPPPPPDPLQSADILARPIGTGPVDVQHIVVGWEGLANVRDPRGKARSKADADVLAADLLAKVRAGADMAALMKQYSEDPGSADTGKAYTVEASSPMIEEFKALALRLNEGEAGLVKTQWGWHVVKRVPPPPPDPLESAAILARTEVAERTKVKHILLGWTELHAEDPRGVKRTRAQLEKLVKATLARLARGAKFEALMAELSEDPGSAKTGIGYDASPDAGLVKPFLDMSLRLKVGEIGVVKTAFGIHIIKRVE